MYGRGIRAAIFDMDGTILDSMRKWRAENRRYLDARGLPVPPDLADTIDTMSSHAFARRFILEHAGEYTLEAMMAEYEAHMAYEYQTNIAPKPGAEAFLKALSSGGVLMCVATATPAIIAKAALDKHGLLGYFEFVTDEIEGVYKKYQPEYYIDIARRLGVEPSECAVFEDAPYAMKAAAGAGMAVFGIEEGVHFGYPDLMRDIRETALCVARDFFEASRLLFHQAPEFRKLSEFPRGIMYALLSRAYAFEPGYERANLSEWLRWDGFFSDRPDIADRCSFVTCVNGAPIGFIAWDPRELPERAEIGNNCIIPEYKGKGYGIAQLNEAVRRILDCGCKSIYVSTDINLLPARRMYERAGFREISREPDPASYAGGHVRYGLLR